ncbi:hypothetical protein V2154_16795 [Ewingella sp. CoE-038-23]|uniref:hypothetical protein n=1 Tax=Ewingella docleensis TaxID=3118588 RepID=UPI003365915C
MSEVTFGQGQLEELAKFTDPQNEIIANLAKALLSTTKQRNEFAQQLSELQLSQQNIINSLGIKGDGPWSKLVIEYVMGLVAERDGLAEKLALAENIAISSANDIAYAIFNLSNKKLSQLKNGIIESTCPTDSALIAERNLRDFAANLCAGRKG